MRMNKTSYKQYDTRWASLPYPKKPWLIKNCGCGEVSVCNCIIEMSKYKGQTPKTIQPYCKQYAAPNGDGTYWSGIPAMMKHYGMTEVKEQATMTALFKELAKGDRVAILLMGSRPGGSKKIHWTSSGHFIAAVGYKKSGDRDFLFIKDSNSDSASRNGWLAYTDSLKGDVLKVWSGKISKPYTPKKAYSGKLPETTVKLGSEGRDVKRVQKFLNWRYNYKLALDGVCGENTVKAIKHFEKNYAKKYGLKVDGVFGAACRKAAKTLVDIYAKKYAPKADPLQKWYDAMKTQYEWSKNQNYKFVNPTVATSKTNGTCITFVAVSLQRLGLLPSGAYFYLYPKTMKMSGGGGGPAYVSSHPDIFSVSYPNKTIAQLGSNLKKGDIIGFGNPAYHTMVYMGKNAKGEPIFNTMGHRKGICITYPAYANRKINMLVRLKKV